MIHARGFTLLETVAVVTILTLVAGVAIVRLGAVHQAAARREAAALWRDLDRLARLEARCRGPVEITLALDATDITLIDAGSSEPLAVMPLPASIAVRVDMDDMTNAIRFDGRGISPDYAVLLEQNGTTHRVRVQGLTGLVLETEDAP